MPTDFSRTPEQIPRGESTESRSTVSLVGPPQAELATVPTHNASPSNTAEIPGYVITGEIARGGMGRVLAARDLTLNREVAIKTVLPGASIERFLTEARITARLPHPGIPPVHALGELPDGSRFLAMKLVRGETLEALLARRQSPLESLSRWMHVFEQIAQAVGFAHAEGVIHRDLKPLNVMVGAFGEVQVMDWGLAKDMKAGETVGSTPVGGDVLRSLATDELTESGAILGTPSYMAPEQARGESLDSRADVFALGSILATILTGRPAFQGKSVFEVVARAASGNVADVHARLDASGADADLVMLARRCLAAEPVDRPADAQIVAADVAAYRSGVEARLRQAETDRAEALVREAEQRKRRRVVQWAGGLIAAVLLAGIVGTSLGLRQASASARAERAAKLLAQQETAKAISATNKERLAKERADAATVQEKASRERAEQERGVALAVRDFLQTHLLRQASPWEQANRGLTLGTGGIPVRTSRTVQELLETAAREFSPESIDGKFPHQPIVQAEILETIGETFEGLGEYSKAVTYVEAAHRLREQHLGRMHPQTLSSLVNMALVQLAASRQADAIRTLLSFVERLEALVQRLPERGDPAFDSHPAVAAFNGVLAKIDQRLDPRRFHFPSVSIGLGEGAMLLLEIGRSIPRMQRLAEVCANRFGEEDRRTYLARLLVGFCYHGLGQVRKACDVYEQVLSHAEKTLPPDDWPVMGLREVLSVGYDALDIKPEERLRLREANLQSQRRVLGAEHPATLITMVNVAALHRDAGKPREAIPLLEHVRDVRTRMLGPERRETILAMHNLSRTYASAGNLSEAIALAEQVRDACARQFGANQDDTLNATSHLAQLYERARRRPEAIALFEQIRDARLKSLGAEHPDTLLSMHNLGSAYLGAERFHDAIAMLEQVRSVESRAGPTKHAEAHVTLAALGRASMLAGDFPRAIDAFEELRRRLSQARGVEHSETLDATIDLASAYVRAGKTPDAIPLFDAYGAARAKTQSVDALTVLNNQGVTFLSAGKLPEAIALLELVGERRAKTLGEDHADTAITRYNLARAYQRAERTPESLPLFDQAARAIVDGRIEHSQSDTILANCIDALEASGELATAESLHRGCLALRQRKTPGNPSAFAGTLEKLGLNLLRQQKWIEAEATLRDRLDVVNDRRPAWTRFHTQSLLGEALTGQARYAEASPLLLNGYEGLKARAATIPPTTGAHARAVDRLIELYEATDNPDEADRWTKERDSLVGVRPGDRP